MESRADAVGTSVALATGAGASDQSLVEDEGQRGGDGESVWHQKAQSVEDTVAGSGVEGREDEMPGEGGLDGESGGFGIADLADDDGLRVLSEQVSDGGGVGEATGFVDLGLHDARDERFDRVFDGDEVPAARLGEFVQRGVDGGGLAAAGRASQEDQTRRLGDGALEGVERGQREAEFAERYG